MKIYFAASILGKMRNEKSAKWQQLIVNALKKRGDEIWDGNLNTEPKKLYEETEDKYLEVFKRNTKIIKESDLVIAEVSMSDSGVGYEIAFALDQKKPVLALYNKNSGEPTAPPIAAGKNKQLTFVRYDEKDIDKILDNYLREVRKGLDSKFILIISPEIDKYLQWASDNKRMHKAQIVRQAIEEMLNRDRDYRLHLTGSD